MANTNPDILETKAAELPSKVHCDAEWGKWLDEPATSALLEIQLILDGAAATERCVKMMYNSFQKGFIAGGKWTVDELARLKAERERN